ncbi:MAG: hypothetical protein HWN81_00480 [Candidatus Lokiarchaeota archaeon]|nr:hypothetical protein [Candidatus Lokiarchaeota archaeon]
MTREETIARNRRKLKAFEYLVNRHPELYRVKNRKENGRILFQLEKFYGIYLGWSPHGVVVCSPSKYELADR